MKKNDFLTKELVNTFVYTTASKNRFVYTPVSINGRTYMKMGELQIVSFVGNVYKIFNSESHQYEYWLFAGLAKQHPCDSKVNKEVGYEVAHINALTNPFLSLRVNKQFGNITWRKLIDAYVEDMDLEFVKTKEEILESNKNIDNYVR